MTKNGDEILFPFRFKPLPVHEVYADSNFCTLILSSSEKFVIMGDKTYRGTFAKTVKAIGLQFEIPQRPNNTKGFVVEAKRWVVERTFAWLIFFRRVAKGYKRTTESAQTFLILVNISICLWRINFDAE